MDATEEIHDTSEQVGDTISPSGALDRKKAAKIDVGFGIAFCRNVRWKD